MKMNKIVGILVAAAGVIASVSVASALYIKNASDVHFGIGAKWSGLGGTITYKINDATSGSVEPSYLKTDGSANDGEGFGGEYTQAHYEFSLGASFSSDVPVQSYVVGNFSVSLTNINFVLQNNAKIWVGVDGYTDDTYGKIHYGSAFMDGDADLTGATYSVDSDIVVASSNVQTVNVYVKLNEGVSDEALLALDEGKAFDISVSWGAPTNFEFAHVVGEGTMWQEDDVYAMVPNINKEGDVFEWMYTNLPGSMGNAKCKKGDTWSVDPEAVLEKDAKYDVYWSGSSSETANFVKQGENE